MGGTAVNINSANVEGGRNRQSSKAELDGKQQSHGAGARQLITSGW